MLKTLLEKFQPTNLNIHNVRLKKGILTVKFVNLAIFLNIGISILTNANHAKKDCILIKMLVNVSIPLKIRNTRQILMHQRTFTLMEILNK